jgi:hypothetical protein
VNLKGESQMSIETLAKQLGVTYDKDIAEKGAKGLLRELPGYTAIADDAAELLSKHGKTLKLEAGKKELEEALALVKKLSPIESQLEKLYQSIYYQRLNATHEVMQILFDSSRRIREFSNAYPEIAEEAGFLLNFMKTFRPGRSSSDKES